MDPFTLELIELDVCEDITARALAKLETGVWGGVGFAGRIEPEPAYTDSQGRKRGGGPGRKGGGAAVRRGLLYSDLPLTALWTDYARSNRARFEQRLEEETTQ